MTSSTRFASALLRSGAAILIGVLVLGGSAGAAWILNAHREDAVSQELDGMMQKLSTDDRVRYFGNNIISWGIDHQDQILRVGVENPKAITIDARKWLGPRAFYYRTTRPELFGIEELRTNRLSAEAELGCTLSPFINAVGYAGDTPEAALRAIAWTQFSSREPVDYELWTGGPLTQAYTEPAPATYLAFTPGDHLGLGVATVSKSGTSYTAGAWECGSDARGSVAASTSDTPPSP